MNLTQVSTMLDAHVAGTCWKHMLDAPGGGICWRRMLEAHVGGTCWRRTSVGGTGRNVHVTWRSPHTQHLHTKKHFIWHSVMQRNYVIYIHNINTVSVYSSVLFRQIVNTCSFARVPNKMLVN